MMQDQKKDNPYMWHCTMYEMSDVAKNKVFDDTVYCRLSAYLSGTRFSCTSGGGGRIQERHRKMPLRMLRVTSTISTTMQCTPYTINCRLTSTPAMNDMTSTAVGHAVHATDSKNIMSAQADVNMHSAGIRAEIQKNRYLP